MAGHSSGFPRAKKIVEFGALVSRPEKGKQEQKLPVFLGYIRVLMGHDAQWLLL